MKEINTPEELLSFMKENIDYGYLGKNGKIYYKEDKEFDSKWYNEYILETPNQVLNNLCGNCFDQVEFEREWFEKHKYEVKTIFEMVKLEYKNDYPTHSYLVYKDENNKWNWFENADFINRGIHTFNTYEELIEYQYSRYLCSLKTYNIQKEEIEKIVITEFNKPKGNITAEKYLNHVISSKTIRGKINE